MVIDADITKAPDGQAICAHWPATTSDLGFSELIAAMRGTPQALKLDFKDQDIVAGCLRELAAANLSQPVILNADILSLHGAPAPDFDGREFLHTCRSLYPRGLISVGWRTEDNPASPYTARDVAAMLELTEGVTPLTFPVRASLLPASWPAIKMLLAHPNHSLLIWNANPASPALQSWLTQHVQRSRVFFELPGA